MPFSSAGRVHAARITAGPAEAPHVRLGTAERRVTCRCGTALDVGSPTIEVLDLPDELEPLFPETIFCSRGCLRAEFLEKRELLDGLMGLSAPALVTDLERTYVVFNRTLQVLGSDRAPLSTR